MSSVQYKTSKTTKGPVYSAASTVLGGRPRVTSDSGAVYVMGDGMLRYPPEFSTSFGSDWATINRDGRKPLKRFQSTKLRTLQWKVSIGHADWKVPCARQVRWFTYRSEHHQKIRFTGHGSKELEQGRWWIIDDCSINVTQRAPSGEVSRAEVTLSLTEASDVPSTAAKKPKPKKKKRKERKYRMKKGDTLWELSRRYYKNPYKWPRLAKRNKIKNVRRIPIGKIIYIP